MKNRSKRHFLNSQPKSRPANYVLWESQYQNNQYLVAKRWKSISQHTNSAGFVGFFLTEVDAWEYAYKKLENKSLDIADRADLYKKKFRFQKRKNL